MSARARHALCLLLVACNRTPSAPGKSAAPAPGSAAAAPSASVASEEQQRQLPDGCWLEVDRDAGAQAVLTALAGECAPAQTALLPRTELKGKSGELSFDVPDGGACVRVLAAARRGTAPYSLAIVDGSGRVIAEERALAELGLLGRHGPACLAPGSHRIRVTSEREEREGTLWVDVLSARASTESPRPAAP